MTQESLEIAEAVDRFPAHIRELIRDAALRVVAAYEAVADEAARHLPPQAGRKSDGNVIRLDRIG